MAEQTALVKKCPCAFIFINTQSLTAGAYNAQYPKLLKIYTKMDIIAIIPARKGSKGVPGKNIKHLAGKPLIAWSIEQALNSELVSRVIVSTDCTDIARTAVEAGAEVPGIRPENLSDDNAKTEPVLIHAINEWCSKKTPDAVLLLQPTSPLRLPGSIDASIKHFIDSKSNSLVSTCLAPSFFWKNTTPPSALYNYLDRPRRQDIHPIDLLHKETGSIYITETKTLLSTENRLGGKITLFPMSDFESLEIDTEFDFILLEKIMHMHLSSP